MASRKNTWKFDAGELTVQTPRGEARLGFVAPDILRMRFSQGPPRIEETFIVERPPSSLAARLTRKGAQLLLSSPTHCVAVIPSPLSFRVLDRKGRVLLSTPPRSTVEMRKERVTHAFNRMNRYAPPPRGIKQVTVARFNLKPGARVYGLGQDPMGRLDQRDSERRMWHEWSGKRRSGNDGMPFFFTSAGWGALLNSSWPSRFAFGRAHVADTPVDYGFNWVPAPWPWDKDSGETRPDRMAIVLDEGAMDLFLILRDGADSQLEAYSSLTGRAPMPPKWALGFIQCKNRYRGQEDLLRVAREYRRRRIPLDVLVIDWMWFKEFGDLDWNKAHWPDPERMLKELAGMGVRVLQAQHPYADKGSRLNPKYLSRGFLSRVPKRGRPIVDHSNPAARREWWEDVKPLFEQGIRGYWTDMGEPEHHPPGSMHFLGSRERVHNLYSLLWTKGLYEGHRRDFKERVFSLARSTWAGIQRYGTALWSGDIEACWEVFRDQVLIGQGVALSGQPYWTTDVGGFMTYHRFSPELYARWFEWGVFCPLFRTHGTRPDNEAWSFGPQVEAIVEEYIRLRYRLMPYLYSLARRVTDMGAPIMRAMAADFPDDPRAVAEETQFMFGPALLVAPVIEEDARTRRLYLPRGAWYDFHTGEKLQGGRFIEVAAPLGRIPLFAREGSIIPLGPAMQWTLEKKLKDVEIHAYAGKPGSFDLYDDDGLTYGYEKGAYAKTGIIMDAKGRVKVGKPVGDPKVVPTGRRYRTVMHDGKKGASIPTGTQVTLDHDLKSGGILKVHALVENRTGKPVQARAKFEVPAGWRLSSQPKSIVSVKAGKPGHMQWRLVPKDDALPVMHRAKVYVEVTRGGKKLKGFAQNIEWGSGWPTRFSVIGSFDHKDGKGLDRVYGPEKDPSRRSYRAGKKTLRWKREKKLDFNCFGYVDFRELGVPFPQQGVAYAKGSVWSDKEQTTFIEASGDNSLKVWVNGKLVLREPKIVPLRVFKKPVHLKIGWNPILIKVASASQRPWTGREYGFQLRFIVHKNRIESNMLYRFY